MKTTGGWLGMEGLEERALMAGNVTAEVVDGVVLIKGDAGGNGIIISGNSGDASRFRVSADAMTTINRQSGPVDLSGMSGDVRIDLGSGKNSLEINNLRVAGDLVIDTGRNGDLVRAETVQVGRGLILRTRGGKDVVDILGLATQLDKQINTGDGDDVVMIQNGGGRQLLLNSGAGDDIIYHHLTGRREAVIRGGRGDDQVSSKKRVMDDDFLHLPRGTQGWEGGFADYFKGRKRDQQLKWEFRDDDDPDTAEVNHRPGLYIQGNNNTDDLFMFLTKTLGAEEGIEPNASYLVKYRIYFASNSPSNCSGIGGAPGESVFLKAGASGVAPQVSADEEGLMRLNIDHGQQGGSGKAASVVGNIANGQDCPQEPTFVQMNRVHIHPTLVRTGADGKLHLIVGTESGFEGMTRMYYQRITVEVVKFAKPAAEARSVEQVRPFSQRYVPVS